MRWKLEKIEGTTWGAYGPSTGQLVKKYHGFQLIATCGGRGRAKALTESKEQRAKSKRHREKTVQNEYELQALCPMPSALADVSRRRSSE
jgi:hypothetical protein